MLVLFHLHMLLSNLVLNSLIVISCHIAVHPSHPQYIAEICLIYVNLTSVSAVNRYLYFLKHFHA